MSQPNTTTKATTQTTHNANISVPPSAPVEMNPKKEKSSATICEMLLEGALQVPRIAHLLTALEDRGCILRGDTSWIKCRPCKEINADAPIASTGWFDWDTKELVVCQESASLVSPGVTIDTIAHELVHAYDVCRAKMDTDNCAHIACTEIRAAALAGDCRFTNELLRNKLTGFAGHYQECVKRRAGISLSAWSHCQGKQGDRALRKAWEACFNDLEPYDRVPY